MNRPGVFTRFFGVPLIGVGILLASAVIIYNWWYVGNATWLLALFALAFSVRAIRSMHQMRVYKRWMKEWDAILEPGESAAADPRSDRSIEVLEPMSWMVGTASFAATRDSAEAALPDYAARLLARGRRQSPLEARRSA